MSDPSTHQPAFRDAAKEKGGSLEDARQGKTKMEAVAERAGSRNVVSPAFTGMSENKKLGTWIDRLVADAVAKGKPIARMETLTPAMAALLLESNPDNRKISEVVVERFAHDIAGDRWVFNGEPIIISNTGELNDGQHRCSAVIAANKTIEVVMIVGVERQSRTTLDQGKARMIADYLTMEGHTNAIVLGSAANIIWQVQTRGMFVRSGNASATRSEMMNIISDNPAIKRSVGLCDTKGARATAGPAVLASAHFLISQAAKREDADAFVFQIMEGAGMKAGNPVLYARNRLINDRGNISHNERLELLFKAWNASRRGEKVSRLILTGGVLPVLEA